MEYNLEQETDKLNNLILLFEKNVADQDLNAQTLADKKVESNQLEFQIEKRMLEYKKNTPDKKITIKDMDILIKDEKRKNVEFNNLRKGIYKLELEKKNLDRKYELLRQIKQLRIAMSQNIREIARNEKMRTGCMDFEEDVKNSFEELKKNLSSLEKIGSIDKTSYDTVIILVKDQEKKLIGSK